MTQAIDVLKVEIVPDLTKFDGILEGEVVGSIDKLEAQTEAVIKAMEAQFAELAGEIASQFGVLEGEIVGTLDGIAGDVAGLNGVIESDFAEMGAAVDAIFEEVQVNASHQLDQVAAKSAETSGLVKGAFDSLASGASLAGTAVAGGLGLLTVFGLKSSASIEQTKVAFQSLTGSVSAGNAQFAQLQAFAAATPFEFNDLTTGAKRFDAFAGAIGQTQAQLIPFLTTIGDLVSETGGGAQSLDSITLALGQTASQGKLTLGNLNQINNAIPGFSSVAAIAAVRGQTAAQVMQEISAGEIDAKTGINQLVQGMKEFPGAAGAMAKQSQTLLGVFSTFHDVVSQSLADAFAPAIPAIKDTLGQLTPIIGDALGQLAPALGKLLTQLLPLIGNLITGLVPVITPILKALGDAAVALGPTLVPIGDALGKLFVAIGPLIPVLAVLAAKFIIALVPALLALTPLLVELTNSLIPIFNFIGKHVDDIMMLASAFLAIAGAIKLYNIVMGIAKTVTEALTAVELAMDVAMDANPIALVVLAVLALAAGIIWLATKTQFFQTVWAAIWDFLKMVGAWFAGPFVDFFVGVGNWFAGPFLVPFLAIGHFFSGPFLDPFKAIGHFFSVTLVNWFWTAVHFVESIPGKILGAFDGLVTKLFNLGHDLVMGLVHGLENVGGQIWTTLKGFVTDAIDKAKSLLGINSPSKVFMEIGQSIVEGTTKGVTKDAPDAHAAISGMLSPKTAVAGASVGGGGFMIAAGAIVVNVSGSISAQQAYQVGAAVGQGITDQLATRDIRQQVRTM